MSRQSPFDHVQCASLTDTGKRRSNNEDASLCLPESGLVCVADGMGGAEHGEVASMALVEALEEAFSGRHSVGVPSLDDAVRLVREAAINANAWILEFARESGISATGSTLVTLLLDPDDYSRAAVLHAGDSRAYRLRGETLTQITRDHSLAAKLDLPDSTHSEQLFKSVITNAIGARPEVDLEQTPVDVEPGDLFILCSDGLTNMIPDQDMKDLLVDSTGDDLEEVAFTLVQEANRRGGIDNITVALARVSQGSGVNRDEPTTTEDLNSSRRLRKGAIVAAIVSMAVAALTVAHIVQRSARKDLMPHAKLDQEGAHAAIARAMLPEHIDATLVTGRWGLLEQHVTNWSTKVDGYLDTTENAAVYRAWLNLWKRFESGQLDPREQIDSYTAAACAASVEAGFDTPYTPLPGWGSEPGSHADQACKAIYMLQSHIVENAQAYVLASSGNLSVLGPDPAISLSDLWHFSGKTNDAALAACTADIIAATNALHSLERWINVCRDRPIPAAALAVSSRYVQTADDSMSRAEPLLVVCLLQIPSAVDTWKDETTRQVAQKVGKLYSEFMESGQGATPLPWAPETRSVLSLLFKELRDIRTSRR